MTTKSSRCELCLRKIRGEYYSADACNRTGYGIELHRRCAEVLDRIPEVCHRAALARAAADAAQTPAAD